MEHNINERNFDLFYNNWKELHLFKCAKNKQGVVILSSELYNFIAKNKLKIYIGYQC